jgi:hypothetical protein
VDLLVSGAEAKVMEAGNRIEIEVPGIETIEVIHLTWD